jgi:DNA polymerase-1
MNVNLVETFDEAEQFMHWLSERRPILACDTETGGLEFWKDELRLVQFGDHDTGWAIPFHMWGGLALDAIASYEAEITFHNAKFDVRYLGVNGANLRYDRVHDTRVMAHLLEPSKPTHLKTVGVRLLGANSDEWESALGRAFATGKWSWATVPVTLPEYWQYACMDTILTARLHELLYPQLTGKLKELYEMEIAIEQIIDEQERRGIRVDIPYAIEQRDIFLHAAEEIEQWCIQTYGFGTGSHSKVAAQLQADGIVLTKHPKDSAAWSVDESVLKPLQDQHDLAKYVLKARKATKYGNAYFGNYIDMADNGRLHCDVNTLGARTGRMSVSRPALQQIPREALLRDAFIPSEGNRLVSVDYDQIEMRLLAHYSQDPAIIAAFREPGDFFMNSVNRMYHLHETDKKFKRPQDKEPLRNKVKTLGYGLIYGEGAKTFAEKAEITLEEAHTMTAEYHAEFTGVKPFMTAISDLGKRRLVDEHDAYLTTPLGRREVADDDRIYALVNYLIQGSAADIFKQALIKLDNLGLLDRFVLPVHDEVLFDVPLGEAEDLGHEVAVAMERTDFTIPLTGGMEVLEKWGTKYQ